MSSNTPTSDLPPLEAIATPDGNRARLETLKRLFPDLFSAEGRLNPDELRRLAEAEGTVESERYEFRWHGKQRSKRHAFTPTLATLAPDASRSVNPTVADGNAIIEGENLEALKLLLPAYRGRIKCIYIDPPYNTGNDFVYRDNYARDRKEYWEETGATVEGVKVETNPDTSGRYHSDWLSMIHSRLLLAWQLLREDGAIFVSIDDNEVSNLRRVMDEVFGEENFIESFVWKKSYGGGAKEKFAVRQHEYCLLYARSIEHLPELWLPPDEEAEARYYKLRDEHAGTRGPYRIKPLEATKSMDARENLVFPIPAPDGTEIWPKRQWWWSQERVKRVQAENGLVFAKTPSGWSVSYKQYLIQENGEKRGAKPFSVIDGFYTQQGTDDLRRLFDDQVLVQFPKPVRLLKYLFQFGAGRDDLILDFFAGSGTTAQAVLELNQSDGGNRRFILVQLPELTAPESPAFKAGYKRISDITIDRVRRVIRNMNVSETPPSSGDPGPETDPALPLGDEVKASSKVASVSPSGFHVLKLRPSHFPRAEFAPDPSKSREENLAALDAYLHEKERSLDMKFHHDELLEEVLLKSGFGFGRKVEKLSAEFPKNAVYRARETHDGTERTALICLDPDRIDEDTVSRLQSRPPERFICLELALDTTRKWTLRQHLGELLTAL